MISLYIWSQVRKEINRKVTYQHALDFEIKNSKNNKLNLSMINLDIYKPWKIINTRFGLLDLYKYGDFKKVVIFVHGILSNNRTSIKVVEYFNSRGYSVISYDNFGWGKSRFFGKTKLGIKEKDLLFDVITNVKNILKPKKLVITGESMGGATVYAFLGKYGNQHADKFIIDAGYFSFFDNVVHLSYDRVSFLAYLSLPFLSLLFLFEKWPIKSFLTSQKLKEMDNIFHIHSKSDKLVKYSHVQKFLKHIKPAHIHIYEKDVSHVLGWYEAREEHEKVYDKWLGESK